MCHVLCVYLCIYICLMLCIFIVHTGGWCFRGWFTLVATKKDWTIYNTYTRGETEEEKKIYKDIRKEMPREISEELVNKYRSAFCIHIMHNLCIHGTSANDQAYHMTSLLDLKGGSRSLIRVFSKMKLCSPLRTWDMKRKLQLVETQQKLR